jgi:hypothetical protein
MVTIPPVTTQTAGVVETKLTARPELAVAAMGIGPAFKPALLKGPKAMVWDAWPMVKFWVTGAAAA